ncbi:MAG TPA: protein-L-isoaspartate(D-aspartate) O-methyltransferase [Anaerohalosphaeraceae bacterium]|nr:protein-L-isoaspartate(D-aspartate) O-methyltransferase [Anaerohalosphaeraceae bacterium]
MGIMGKRQTIWRGAAALGVGLIGGVLVCLCVCLCSSCRQSLPESVGGAENSRSAGAQSDGKPNEPDALPRWNRPRTEERQRERLRMVERIRQEYGLQDEAVLEAMRNVPRHWFVPPDQSAYAYYDSPLPIGYGQTISQPFIVAYMTSVLALEPNDRVLEIGTGSGYQAAVLNEFTPNVFTIEIIRPLAERAMETFRRYGYETIRVRIGDGYKGWPEEAPFDAIVVTCAPDKIPPPLLEQLKVGGRMIIPVGSEGRLQELVLVEKDSKGQIRKRSVMDVRFVPLLRQKE